MIVRYRCVKGCWAFKELKIFLLLRLLLRVPLRFFFRGGGGCWRKKFSIGQLKSCFSQKPIGVLIKPNTLFVAHQVLIDKVQFVWLYVLMQRWVIQGSKHWQFWVWRLVRALNTKAIYTVILKWLYSDSTFYLPLQWYLSRGVLFTVLYWQ